MTGDMTWKTITDTGMVHIVWAVHGIGAGITVLTGAAGGIMTHGITAVSIVHGTTTPGTMEDGMTLGIMEDIMEGTMDGATHGIITTAGIILITTTAMYMSATTGSTTLLKG